MPKLDLCQSGTLMNTHDFVIKNQVAGIWAKKKTSQWDVFNVVFETIRIYSQQILGSRCFSLCSLTVDRADQLEFL